MTIAEIAAKSGVGEATIRKMIKQKILHQFADETRKTISTKITRRDSLISINKTKLAYKINKAALIQHLRKMK